ncbi:hypothetical protein BsWGS_07489 [Bradybaena similaris]
MSHILILLVCSTILQGVFSAEWAYTGTYGVSHWASSFPDCGHDHQSPINILEGDVRIDRHLPPINYTNYDISSGLAMALRNNGHSVTVTMSGATEVTVSAGGLPGVFRAFQFHFHWGGREEEGSEHLINGVAYPLELHIVHYNTKYPHPGVAMQNPDGMAVFGFFYEKSEEDNLLYSSIVDSLPKVLYPDLETKIAPVSLISLLPTSFNRFFRYSGSLTTPPCQESVTWTVLKDTIKISKAQLEVFRLLLNPHASPLYNNYRPVQPLNHRQVTANFDPAIRWTYSAAGEWQRYYSACQGHNQSPITIPTHGSRFDPKLQKLDFDNYDKEPDDRYKLINTGHTVSVDISPAEASISGGGLPGTYQAERLHFHWGSTDQKGSEHTLDGRVYPMELQIVHYKKSGGKLSKAIFQTEGLAILTVFFEISPRDNRALSSLVKSLRSVRSAGTMASTEPFSLSSLLPSGRRGFYRYTGSLTIPGCYENVIWTVFKDTIKISPSQLAAFRLLKSFDKDEHGHIISLVNNYRPVQGLNRRVVTRNFNDDHKLENERREKHD